jgi:hypothetical protein
LVKDPVSPQRGPPYKPLQSKYALWVGNIPSQTRILDFRNHFVTRHTAKDILSVVLLPSSASGFVNFRSGEACRHALHLFQSSSLFGAPLSCRIRKFSGGHDPSQIVQGPLSPVTALNSLDSVKAMELTIVCDSRLPSDESTSQDTLQSVGEGNLSEEASQTATSSGDSAIRQTKNRYFILKSLTYQDLENSVESNCWSTQSQNEEQLNEVFNTGDQVYLIFSVNKSREFFGYARMKSKIEANIDPGRKDDKVSAFASPPTIATQAEHFIPAGRIVDELSRGKIYWEAEPLEISPPDGDHGSEKSFTIEWISLTRIPFWQTKHLKNKMNGNREVKVGRDGTEIDTKTGGALCNLFHPIVPPVHPKHHLPKCPVLFSPHTESRLHPSRAL